MSSPSDENMASAPAVGVQRPCSAWRLLTRLDEVQETDEYLLDDCETWKSCADAMQFILHRQYDPLFFQPMRRKCEPNGQSAGTAD